MSDSKSIVFTYSGQAPSKSNFRWSARSPESRRKWKRVRAFEDAIGWKALQAGGGQKLRETLGKQVSVEIVAVNQRTDLDNICKSVLDGMEGIIYANDRDVAVSIASLRPERDDGAPYLQVTVRWG